MASHSWQVLATPEEVTAWFFLAFLLSQIVVAIFWITQPRKGGK